MRQREFITALGGRGGVGAWRRGRLRRPRSIEIKFHASPSGLGAQRTIRKPSNAQQHRA
jgi:hypothetical protein